MPSDDRTGPNLAAGLVAMVLFFIVIATGFYVGSWVVDLAASAEIESSCAE